jgi:hypothetical protein
MVQTYCKSLANMKFAIVFRRVLQTGLTRVQIAEYMIFATGFASCAK